MLIDNSPHRLDPRGGSIELVPKSGVDAPFEQVDVANQHMTVTGGSLQTMSMVATGCKITANQSMHLDRMHVTDSEVNHSAEVSVSGTLLSKNTLWEATALVHAGVLDVNNSIWNVETANATMILVDANSTIYEGSSASALRLTC